MYDEDILSWAIGIFMVLCIVLGGWGLWVSSINNKACIDLGGELVSSQCVKKGTLLSP